MSTAAILADERFRHVLDAERVRPVQRNLFTGEPDSLHIDVPELLPDDETILDEGISIIKTDDLAQLIVSGYGLYLGKKSERLVVRKDKTIVYQFPFFRIQEVVIGSKGISISSNLIGALHSRNSNKFLGQCRQAICTGLVSLLECDHSNAARSVAGVQ